MKIEVYFERSKALDYLEAREIAVTEFSNASLGRFSVLGEFDVDGKRGVVLSPRESESLYDADLSLFAAEGLSFVVEEIGRALLFYGRSENNKELVSQRALDLSPLKLFPTAAVFKHLFFLLRQSTATGKLSASGLANLLLARLADEKAGTQDDWACCIAGSTKECLAMLKRAVGELEVLEIDEETVYSFCAILSGFRLTPMTPDESDLLVDFFAQVRVYNAPTLHKALAIELAPVFRAIGEALGNVTLETEVLGSHFSVLSGAKQSALVLCLQIWAFLPLLQTLFPAVHVDANTCVENNSKQKTDTIIVTPSYYHTEWLEKKVEQCRANGILIVVSFGHVDTNNEEAFGNDLLKRVQVLGSIHLPLAFGIRKTNSQWSMLIMKKTKPLSSDYALSMLHLETEDFGGEALATTVKLVKDIVQGKTNHATHRCLSGKILEESLEL